MSLGNAVAPANERAEAEGARNGPGPVAVLARSFRLMLEHPALVGAVVFLPSGLGFAAVSLLAAVAPHALDRPLRVLGPWLMLSVCSQLASARVFTLIAQGRPVDPWALVRDLRRVPAAIVAFCLFWFGVYLGLALFVFPALSLYTGLQFWCFALLDQELGPLAALNESWALARRHPRDVFGVTVVTGLGCVILWAVTFGLGASALAISINLPLAVTYVALVRSNSDRS